jgi:hypothetical protein
VTGKITFHAHAGGTDELEAQAIAGHIVAIDSLAIKPRVANGFVVPDHQS